MLVRGGPRSEHVRPWHDQIAAGVSQKLAMALWLPMVDSGAQGL
jgi:hypothetical protein